MVKDEEALREIWSNPITREHFMERVKDTGLTIEQISDIHEIIDAPKSDLFDALAFVAFNLKPKTREQRASSVDVSAQHAEMQDFLQGILDAYTASGEKELTMDSLPRYIKVRYGATSTARKKLGEMKVINRAYLKMQQDLYRY